MSRRQYTRTRQLKPGMVIDQSVIDKKGRALIVKGATLDDFQIDGLLRLGVSGIYTRDGEAEEEDLSAIQIPDSVKRVVEKERVEDRAKIKISEDVKKRVGEGIQYLYSNSDTQKFSETANNIAGELQAAIETNEAIAVDIGALKVSDEYTFKHSVDVAAMAMIIGKKHGLSDQEVREIGIAGLLHDVGKSKIPGEILNKPARLTDDEFEVMKQHSVYGYHILKEKDQFSQSIMMGVLQHHEKINGTGYPLGITGDKMHVYAKIISLADIYDALVTERSYKKGFSQRDAVEMIMAMTAELDIDAMKSFLGSVILYPVDSIVSLSNGEKAKVVSNNPEYILRPTVVGLTTGRVYNLTEDLACASVIIL